MVNLTPKGVFTVLIRGEILELTGSIDREKSDLIGSCVKNEYCESTAPRVVVIDKWKEKGRNGKSYTSMKF